MSAPVFSFVERKNQKTFNYTAVQFSGAHGLMIGNGSVIDDISQLGDGCKIGNGCTLGANSQIGKDAEYETE